MDQGTPQHQESSNLTDPPEADWIECLESMAQNRMAQVLPTHLLAHLPDLDGCAYFKPLGRLFPVAGLCLSFPDLSLSLLLESLLFKA